MAHSRRDLAKSDDRDTGKLVREVKVSSEPEALLAVLKTPAYHFKRIGLEAGPLSKAVSLFVSDTLWG